MAAGVESAEGRPELSNSARVPPRGGVEVEHMQEPGREEDDLAREVIGAAMEVHRQLGPVFPEIVYQRARGIELAHRAIPFVAEAPVEARYRGHIVGEGRLDFLVGESLVVELKAVEVLARIHVAQVLAYLQATGLTLGLLLNFHVPVLSAGVRRVVLTQPRPRLPPMAAPNAPPARDAP